jgi:hypothetical protein
MSQVIDLCRDSGDGKWPNTASVPSLPRSSKRLRDKKESSNDSGEKTATGSTEFVVDLELADEVELSPNKKRRGVTTGIPNGENDAVRKCGQILNGLKANEEDVSSEASKQTRRDDGDDGSVSTPKPPSNASGRQGRVSAWEDRLSELADYRKIHGHCNVPQNYSENPKLFQWVATQRSQYKLQLQGKPSYMTLPRLQELESLAFKWDCSGPTWEDRLSELACYCKIHGHCNVPSRYSENSKLAQWVGNQRKQYRLHLEGKTSSMTPFRVQELESVGFEWGFCVIAWEDRLSELADYRTIHGHCNVPQNYNENPKLGKWVTAQKFQYRLLVEGKTSPMTTFRIQALESLGFEWGSHSAAWKDRLSELAKYRKINGHCNVPQNCSENPKLAQWVKTQRKEYRLQAEGKISNMTLFRVQELDSLDFEWDIYGTAWKDRLSELADYRRIQGHCNVPQRYSENIKLATWVATQRKQYRLHSKGKKSQMTLPRIQALESLGFEWKLAISPRKRTPSLDDEARPVHKKPSNSRQGAISELEMAPSNEMLRTTGYH